MQTYRIDWNSIPWTTPMPGVRFKAHTQDGRKLRLVEFSRGFKEPDWCRKGPDCLVQFCWPSRNTSAMP